MKHDSDKWKEFFKSSVPHFEPVRQANLDGHPRWDFPEGTTIDNRGCPKVMGGYDANYTRKAHGC